MRRRGILFSALLVVGMLLAACGDLFGPGDGPPVGTVDSVTIDQGDITLRVDASEVLTASVEASSGASTAVNWSSSDTAVATVSGDGTVTGVATGSATITATSRIDDTKSDSITVTVIPADGGGGGGGGADAPDLTFSAAPSEIDEGQSATLSWTVTGDYDSIRIMRPGAVEADNLPAAGEHTVSPTISTTYTLEVSYDDGLTVTATARVAVRTPEGAPTISSFTAQVVRGSQIQFDWAATDFSSWEVLAIGSGADISLGGGTGADTTLTAPIPPSTHQDYRLVVSNGLGDDTEEIPGPTTIVTNAEDYDRYDASEIDQEEAIPGSLRAVVHTSPPGSIIGFAADITEILLPGVDVYREISPIVDSHLVIDKDLVISGPAGTQVRLVGASNQPEGDTSQPLTWHSRMVYVAPGVTAELENLELTGGNFIYFGAGINNDGTLTIRNLLITENRAFGSGGGIRNTATGVLTVIDSVIDGNGAYTLDEEVEVDWQIRGVPNTTDDLTGTPAGDGGGIRNEFGGTVTIENSQITNNHARFSGGGISNIGTMSLTDTQVDGNEADFTQYDVTDGEVSYGGGIMNGETITGDGATLTMTAGSIDGNSSAEQGGGYWHARNATATLTNVNIGGNTVGIGGVPGYGGGIMHNFYTGEEDNLDWSTVAFMPDNSANRGGMTLVSNREFSDRGVRPTGLGAQSIDLLDYRISPVPPR